VGGSPTYLDPIVIALIQGPRILDVGCGFGKWGYLCTTNYWETHNPMPPPTKPVIIGCDGYLPNVEISKRNGVYSNVLRVNFPPLPFDNLSFDTVLILDVLEHIQEEKALKLIEEAKRIARYRVIISTPNFPNFRKPHMTITGFNDLEAHISFWSRRRLRQLGFTLYGGGWRPGSRYWRGFLRRLGILKFYDKKLRLGLSSLSLWLPYFAENVVGVWDNENSNQK
jgi:SAM-dependent methyltransferase